MSKKGINIILIVLVLLILAFFTGDVLISFFEEKPENPYAYKIDEFKDVDPGLVKYKETRQFKIKSDNPKGVYWEDGKIYLISDKMIQVIDREGRQISKITLNDIPNCITVGSADNIVLGFMNYISIVNQEGVELASSSVDNEKSVFTSIAISDSVIYVADAGKRRVLYYDINAELLGEFVGESFERATHGFVIPSPFFDLDFNNKGELWIVNSGMHTLQHYSLNGKLINSWRNSSIKIDGFSGCCNPAHYTFSPNGNFITSEKGLVRIKEYDPEGDLIAVVAVPEKFKEHGKAPDLTTDDKGNVIALDFDKKIIRFFEKNNPTE